MPLDSDNIKEIFSKNNVLTVLLTYFNQFFNAFKMIRICMIILNAEFFGQISSYPILTLSL